MASRNFAIMTTNKLKALLNYTSEEDKAAILKVLEAREKLANSNNVEVPEVKEPVTPEEERAIADTEKKGIPVRGRKMTDEECEAFANQLRTTIVNHRCKVVPFNTTEWVDGTIRGIVIDKKTNKVLVAIKSDDGRRLVKTYGSELLRVLDEVVEHGTTRRNCAAERREPWTVEQMEAAIMEAAVNVGKMVTVRTEAKSYRGRITSITPEKRTQRCMYRIEVPIQKEDGTTTIRIMHRISVSSVLTIDDTFDEIGRDMNAKYASRREKAATQQRMRATNRIAYAEARLKKAEEQLEKAKALVREREKALMEAREEALNGLNEKYEDKID